MNVCSEFGAAAVRGKHTAVRANCDPRIWHSGREFVFDRSGEHVERKNVSLMVGRLARNRIWDRDENELSIRMPMQPICRATPSFGSFPTLSIPPGRKLIDFYSAERRFTHPEDGERVSVRRYFKRSYE